MPNQTILDPWNKLRTKNRELFFLKHAPPKYKSTQAKQNHRFILPHRTSNRLRSLPPEFDRHRLQEFHRTTHSRRNHRPANRKQNSSPRRPSLLSCRHFHLPARSEERRVGK